MSLRRLAPAVLLFGGRLAAAAADSPMLYPHPSPGGGALAAGSPGFGTAGMVAIIVAAAAGAWLLFARRRGAPRWGGRGERLLSVAETRPLGNRQYLVVAAYGRRRFLLGVCPARIDLLSSLDDERPDSP